METISTDNERIIKFYNDHKHIDFTTMNLIFLDIIEKISTNLSTIVDEKINMQILSEISELKHEVKTLNPTITIKMNDIKKEYVNDIKLILEKTELNTQDKVNTVISNTNELLISKIKDILPNSNKSIEDCVKLHCNNITQHTSQIIKMQTEKTDNKETIEQIEKTIIEKFKGMQSSLLNNVEQMNDKITLQKQIQDSVNNEIMTFFNKYKTNSSVKGAVSEIELVRILEQIAPSDEIIRCSSETASCDIRLRRKEKHLPTILFESKDYSASVTKDEVLKFERDLQLQKSHGVFVSQNSAITFKNNYEIDIINGLIHVYIHKANYDSEKIKLAIHVIDHLSQKLKLLNVSDEDSVKIQTDDYELLKEEYTVFANKKNDMIESIRVFCRQLISKLEDIQLPILKKISGNQESETVGILCEHCNKFYAKNKASMSAHQKSCKPKPNSIKINTK